MGGLTLSSGWVGAPDGRNIGPLGAFWRVFAPDGRFFVPSGAVGLLSGRRVGEISFIAVLRCSRTGLFPDVKIAVDNFFLFLNDLLF